MEAPGEVSFEEVGRLSGSGRCKRVVARAVQIPHGPHRIRRGAGPQQVVFNVDCLFLGPRAQRLFQRARYLLVHALAAR